ncbi:MAG: methylated-DNA--[protein]-cysteine S-methyltransferase [Flavobacteriaceae bacterium]|nr:methylated-DNA--[protein]-cysteine S-methyltransferase [Flavobacteriaceae bacterium]
MSKSVAVVYIKTPIGICEIKGSELGVSQVSILDDEGTISETVPRVLQNCVIQLEEYFKGDRKVFDLQLDYIGTDFQKRVWKSLDNIPYGKTTTYLKQARLLGDEKAIRAVATANGRNPFWIVLPCHRVVGSDGALTGYAGGLWRKKWLLEHEQGCEQQSLF